MSPANDRRMRLLQLAALGAATAVFQALFAREFLAAFTGNEAVIASLFGPWLVLTALGARLGRRAPRGSGAAGVVLAGFGLLAYGALLGARALPALFEAGASPGPASALAWAAVLLAAPCIASGLVFAWASADLGGEAGQGYAAEAAGAAIAGAALSLLLLGRVPGTAIAAVLVPLLAFVAARGSGRAAGAALGVAGLALGVALFALGFDRSATRAQLRTAEVELRESPYSAVAVARSAAQTTLFANRLPIAATGDAAAAEEAAHLALGLTERPRRIAVLGVAPPGTLAQLFAHGVERIDYVLQDPVLLEELRTLEPGISGDRVQARLADPRRFLRLRPETFDAVLLFGSEPLSAQANREYTSEFFAAAAGALRPDGVLALSLPGHSAQPSLGRRRLHSSVRRTLADSLGEVVVLPASRTFYVAARAGVLGAPDKAPERIASALQARGVRATHLTRAMLGGLLTPARMDEARRWSALPEAVNRDLDPTTYRLALDALLGEFGEVGVGALAALALALLAAGLVAYRPRTRPVQLAVMTSGAASMSTQLVLMLAYQIATGALYREIGLLSAGFMAGGAAGALLGRRLAAGRPRVLALDVAQLALALGLAAALPSMVSAMSDAGRAVAFGIAALVGLLPGAQFAAAARLPEGERSGAGGLWAADLLGASIASLATFTLLVPALGLAGALALAAGSKALSSAALALPSQGPAPRPEGGQLAPLLMVALLFAVGLAAAESTQGAWYAFTFWRPYPIAAVAALVLALLSSFSAGRWGEVARRAGGLFAPLRARLRAGVGRLAWFLVLAPAGGFALGRCYFSVPMVFCHVCPRQCVFGVLRPYAIPAALLANVHDRRFCERVCPLGTAQSACERARGRRARRLRWLNVVRLAVLAAVAVAYFVAKADKGAELEGGGLYAFFFKNSFTPGAAVLLAVAALVVLSFFVRRPFCEGLCPVGAASDLLWRLEWRLTVGARARPGPGAEVGPR